MSLKNRDQILIERRAWYSQNKERVKRKFREYYLKNKEKVLTKNKLWAKSEKGKERSKRYYQQNKDIIRKANKKWRNKNQDRLRQYAKQYSKLHSAKTSYEGYTKGYNYKKRLQVLIHYSSNPPQCKCCNENIIQFLSIDHINGGGNKHRKESKIGYIYSWLIKNNFPEGFQVLCHNCNMAKGYYGECPHSSNNSPPPFR